MEPITQENVEMLERQPYHLKRKRRVKVKTLLETCKLIFVSLLVLVLLSASSATAYLGWKTYRVLNKQVAPIAELISVSNGDLPAEKAVVVRGLFGGLMDIMRATGANVPHPPGGGSWSRRLVDTSDYKKTQ